MNDIQMIAQRDLWAEKIDIGIRQRRDRSASYVTCMTFEECHIGANIEPAFSLDMQEAQKLMDSLWDCGLRPTEGAGSAGSLMATEKHLNDMRAIVASQLEVKL